MLLIVDNYDSFVYNIVQNIDYPYNQILIKRNDKISISDIQRLNPEAIIISPGPMSPSQAGISKEVIKEFYTEIPILGICLGHQCIGEVFGYKVVKCYNPVHGKKSSIHLGKSLLFNGLDSTIDAARYHSLCIEKSTNPYNPLRIIAQLDDGMIMGVKHEQYPTYGLQFHPESILSGKNGIKILYNFIHKIVERNVNE